MKKNEAVHLWVSRMNAIQTQMIAKLMSIDPDEWEEVTIPSVGDTVIYEGYKECEILEITDEELDPVLIEFNDGEQEHVEMSSLSLEHEDMLPMWGTMWSFDDSCDESWLEDEDGIEKMSRCGFRIYKSWEFGYFFGIDGAGYNFYELHWTPLYDARELQWHSDSEE